MAKKTITVNIGSGRRLHQFKDVERIDTARDVAWFIRENEPFVDAVIYEAVGLSPGTMAHTGIVVKTDEYYHPSLGNWETPLTSPDVLVRIAASPLAQCPVPWFTWKDFRKCDEDLNWKNIDVLIDATEAGRDDVLLLDHVPMRLTAADVFEIMKTRVGIDMTDRALEVSFGHGCTPLTFEYPTKTWIALDDAVMVFVRSK
jgi:hypothetical protein